MTITIIKPHVILETPVAHIVDYMKLLEVAGRTCYKSEERITEGSADKFVGGIVRRGHESVLEHVSIIYRFIMSRAASHQLVRHRICGFSQESQRYCDYGDLGFQIILPPSIADTPMAAPYIEQCAQAYDMYNQLRDRGIPPEDARFVLPNASKTELMMSTNLRQWRHVIRERGLNKHAQWEIRQLMQDVLYELNNYLPVIFGDLVEELAAMKGKS